MSCRVGELKCIGSHIHKCISYVGNDGQSHTKWKRTIRICGPNWNEKQTQEEADKRAARKAKKGK